MDFFSNWNIPIPTHLFRNKTTWIKYATFIVYTIEMETASDSLHDIRGWKVVKNLGAYDFNLLYK